ncbi:MAG: DegV family protein [Tepidanaerobacteraceae bacterium]
MKIKIITDSSNDLPQEILDRYEIDFASLTIAFDDEAFHDGKNLSRDEFYFRLIEAKQYPKTSQPSPQAFYDLIKDALDKGYEVLVITLSSALSGTYESACIAKKQLNAEEQEKVHIVDTLAASIGQGLLVYEAAKMAEQGMSAIEICEKITALRQKLESIFTVDTLEYLLKGGRISKFKATLGTMLDIKPILFIDSNGKLVILEKVRGRKRAYSRLLDIMDEKGKNLSQQTVGIVHSRALQEAQKLANEIKSRFDCKDIIIGELSATIGTHTGPKCIGLFFYH